MAKKKKVRVDLRKNRSKPPRQQGWTRGFQEHGYAEDATIHQERVRAKGDLSRKRTIIQDDMGNADSGSQEGAEMPSVDADACVAGRVLRVHGLHSYVQTDDGRSLRCAVRRLLKTLATDERSVVATGDRVWVRLGQNEGDEGMIERVEPRHGLLTRSSRGKEHVLVANVDQVVIVVSLVEPELKPHLIDRYLASAEQGKIAPVVCLNKVDLVDAAIYQPIVGLYAQLQIPVLLTSAGTGVGIGRLRQMLKDRQTVFSGQSGVGKSSLLNAIEPQLALRVREVSDVNQKGKHTTTTAELIRLEGGGWVVDTPGIRQFELWDIIPEEVEGFFPEFRPLVQRCAFADCTHTHEEGCAIKEAVLRRLVSSSRYTSYLGIYTGKMEDPAGPRSVRM
jgi:ribosome biogenesis GTPase / thiamine phosphate phosphatase